MKKISKYLSQNPRYNRLKKPLEAAEICDAARALARSRYEVVSYKMGLLTLAVQSSHAAANLQAESAEIIDKINQSLPRRQAGISREAVKKIRFKISN